MYDKGKPEQSPGLDNTIARHSKLRPHEVTGATIIANIEPDPISGIYKNKIGLWVVDVIVNDPITNRPVKLNGVKLLSPTTSAINKLTDQKRVLLTYNDQRDVNKQLSSRMTASVINDEVSGKNTSIPMEMLMNNFRDMVGGNNKTCKIGKFNFTEATENIGRMRGLTVLSDANNPGAGGVVIDNTTGSAALYSKSGGNIKTGQGTITTDTKALDIQSARVYRQGYGTLGLPGKENLSQDIYPRSNILLNITGMTMPYVLDYAKFLSAINVLYKIVRVGMVAGEIIKKG